MTVLEMMERAGTKDTSLSIAFIKDAIMQIQSTAEESIEVKSTRDYDIPAGTIAIRSVSVLDTEDDNKYKRIRRLGSTPVVTEDTSP